MPEPCAICQHAKRQAIDADLRAGTLTLSVMATRHRISKSAIAQHAAHLAPEHPMDTAAKPTVVLWHTRGDAPLLSDRPLVRFKQAWHDAKDDAQELARMISWLNEQLQQNPVEWS